MWVTHPGPLKTCLLVPTPLLDKAQDSAAYFPRLLPWFRSFAFPPSGSREELKAAPSPQLPASSGPTYAALPFPQAPYFPFPAGFVSAAAGARRACLGKAFSVSLGLLYLETQDKHKGVRWPRHGRRAAWGRHGGSMQARSGGGGGCETLWCSWGLFIAGWFGTMRLLLSDGTGNRLAREL